MSMIIIFFSSFSIWLILWELHAEKSVIFAISDLTLAVFCVLPQKIIYQLSYLEMVTMRYNRYIYDHWKPIFSEFFNINYQTVDITTQTFSSDNMLIYQ